jgi:translocation and assembly module TamB
MREGDLHFMGHRFELEQARLLLDGAVPPRPAFAGEASARAGGMEAHLRLSGTLAQPRLDLRSTPDLPPEEIVSRLLFGHESQGISPFQAARLAYGLEVLRGGQPLFDLLDHGQDLIRADELEFTQDDDDGGSALAVGKRLSERVTLRGEKGFGGASDRVLLQIELLPELILETATGTQMREGLGLLWRLDY